MRASGARPSLGIEGNGLGDRRKGTSQGAVSVEGGEGGGLSQAAVSFGRGHSSRRPGPGTVKDGWALLPPLSGGEPREPDPAPPAPHPGSAGDAGLGAPGNVEVFCTIFYHSVWLTISTQWMLKERQILSLVI